MWTWGYWSIILTLFWAQDALSTVALNCWECGKSSVEDPKNECANGIDYTTSEVINEVCYSKAELKPSGGVEIVDRGTILDLSGGLALGCSHPGGDQTKWDCYCGKRDPWITCNGPKKCYVCNDCPKKLNIKKFPWKECKSDRKDGRVTSCSIEVTKEGQVNRGCKEGLRAITTPDCREWDASVKRGSCQCNDHLCNDMMFFAEPLGFGAHHNSAPKMLSSMPPMLMVLFACSVMRSPSRSLLLFASLLLLVGNQILLVESARSKTCYKCSPPTDCKGVITASETCPTKERYICMREYKIPYVSSSRDKIEIQSMGCIRDGFEFYLDYNYKKQNPQGGSGGTQDGKITVTCNTDDCNSILKCYHCTDCFIAKGAVLKPCDDGSDGEPRLCNIEVDWSNGKVNRGCSKATRTTEFKESDYNSENCEIWNGHTAACQCFYDGCNSRAFSKMPQPPQPPAPGDDNEDNEPDDEVGFSPKESWATMELPSLIIISGSTLLVVGVVKLAF